MHDRTDRHGDELLELERLDRVRDKGPAAANVIPLPIGGGYTVGRGDSPARVYVHDAGGRLERVDVIDLTVARPPADNPELRELEETEAPALRSLLASRERRRAAAALRARRRARVRRVLELVGMAIAVAIGVVALFIIFTPPPH